MYPILIALIVYLIIIPLTPLLDLTISSFFYDPATGFSSDSFWKWVYRYGAYPVWIVGGISCFCFIRNRSKTALVYLCTCAFSFLIEKLLKTFWPRPRPVQTDLFGGDFPYQVLWIPAKTAATTLASLPSGHAMAGFVFISLIIMGYYKKEPLPFWSGIFLTGTLGTLLSLTRLAQGGHYFSDILSSFLIVFCVAMVSACIVGRK